MSTKDKTLTCRACNVAANCVINNGEIDSAQCPNCRVSVIGAQSQKMIRDLARYYATKEAKDAIGRAVRGSKYVKHKPTRIQRPNWPFILSS